MKELDLNKEGLILRQSLASTRELTTQAREGYSKGGDNFMATEGQSNMPPNSQPTSLEHAGEVPQAPRLGVEKPVSAERQAAARGAWDKAGEGKTRTFEERRMIDELIRRGRGPTIMGGAGEVIVEKTGITNPSIVAEIDTITNLTGIGLQQSEVLTQALGNISKFVGDDREKQIAIDRIKDAITIAKGEEQKRRPEQEQDRRYSLYFTPAEQEALREDPTRWLDTQFDILYRFAEEGQELSSPIINGIQQQVSQAVDFVKNYRPEVMSEFQTQFTVRLHLLQTRTAIGYRNIENIKQAAHELRFHGLLEGMKLEKGMVGAMFNRFQDLLESTRLSSNTRHHVMLEDAYDLQKVLIEEQMKFAKKGIGNFDDLSDIVTKKQEEQTDNPDTWDDFTWAAKKTGKQIEENKGMSKEQIARIMRIKRVNASITRSVRTAYDVFVSSQRRDVVVARGKYLLTKDDRYRSDLIGLGNVYNMEELLFEKFEMYSPQQEEMVNRIKLDMADTYLKEHPDQENPAKKLTEEERLDLGKRLFRDLFAVPDFFSSGWRIDGVIQALEERFGKDKAKNFALFMRLKRVKEKKEPDDKPNTEYREDVWKKIKDFRPEEIIRLFRERKNDKVASLYNGMIAIDSDLRPDSKDTDANRSVDEGGRGKEITVYDKFKKKYGSIIGLLRQEGFNFKDSNGRSSPTQVNLSNLSEAQKKIVNDFLGIEIDGWKKLSELARLMQDFIDERHLVNDLLTDNNFADIYTRSIIIDDALLDKLEDEKPETNGVNGNLGHVPLSKIIGEAGAGGDTLVRSWNDTENAAKAGNALIKFIKEEDLEKKTNAALEFAGSASMYNGLGAKGQAEGVRYTIGTFLNLSKLDMAWDIVGITHLPFKIPTSDAGRIFGSQVQSMSRDELRKNLEHLRGFLTSSISKAREQLREDEKALGTSILYDTPEKRAKRKEELEAKFARDEEGSQKFYKNLEELLEVTTGDNVKKFGLRLILYLMLAAIGETYVMASGSKTSK